MRVPLSTHPAQFPHAVPPPAVMVRAAMRELLSIAPPAIFTVNPMTGQGWTITADDHAFMREVLWRRRMACEQPRPDAPWAFRAPSDDEAPLAAALASWCAQNGIAQAYLYRLDRNDGSGEQIVLGLVHPADPELRAVALERARRPAGRSCSCDSCPPSPRTRPAWRACRSCILRTRAWAAATPSSYGPACSPSSDPPDGMATAFSSGAGVDQDSRDSMQDAMPYHLGLRLGYGCRARGPLDATTITSSRTRVASPRMTPWVPGAPWRGGSGP